MIYELRIYEAALGKLPALNERFQKYTTKLWTKYGFKAVGFWTYALGGANDQLVYMLQWESLEQMEKAWAAFQADPEWNRVRDETQKDGVLTLRVHNSILRPTPYSPMQ